VACVSRIYTDLATIDVTPDGLVVLDMIEGLTLNALKDMTGVPLQMA
jgi:3-oxoadipate CoA-transferase beta subunit